MSSPDSALPTGDPVSPPILGTASGAFEDMRYETTEDGIAKITICRPEVHNAFRPQWMTCLAGDGVRGAHRVMPPIAGQWAPGWGRCPGRLIESSLPAVAGICDRGEAAMSRLAAPTTKETS